MCKPAATLDPAPVAGSPGRWWIYQRERFPLALNGLAILFFSIAATCYGWSLSAGPVIAEMGAPLVSFAGSFIFFALLRIADEFKDFEDDSRYRPYRAVPRGLIKLSELGRLGALLALVQAIVTLYWSPGLFYILLATWAYFFLMCREFFAPDWLKAHPLVYLFSHMLIMPMIALYATAPAWLGKSIAPEELAPFLLLSFCIGITGEIGRKIRALEDEETGVDTYSALWGQKASVAAWLLSVLAIAASTDLAAGILGAGAGFTTVMVGLCGISIAVGAIFLVHPVSRTAKAIEATSGLCALISFGALAIFAFPTFFAVG